MSITCNERLTPFEHHHGQQHCFEIQTHFPKFHGETNDLGVKEAKKSIKYFHFNSPRLGILELEELVSLLVLPCSAVGMLLTTHALLVIESNISLKRQPGQSERVYSTGRRGRGQENKARISKLGVESSRTALSPHLLIMNSY